jgi:predicted phosphodiesterase
MRLLILSDLHVEYAPFEAPSCEFDIVVLAGDIHNGVEAIRWARRTFERSPVIQVAGNHEFFGAQREATLEAMREQARAEGVHFLENDAVELNGVEFLGATLWTDYRIYETPRGEVWAPQQQAMQANLKLIADYWKIEQADGRSFAPADAIALHARSRGWLEARLAQPATTARVVVSHHLPSWKSVAPAFERSITNAAFVTELDPLVAQCNLWIHGHTHTSQRYLIEQCEVVANPRGYPWRSGPAPFENPQFNPELVVEI